MTDHSRIAAAFLVALALAVPVAARDDFPTIASPGAAARTPVQESQSARAAAALTALLDQHKLEAIAARDPDRPGQVVAALYVPGSQLLVVSAPYPVAAVLDQRLAEGKYMDVYLDLQAPMSHDGHFFVADLLADGLRPVCDRDQPFDSTARNGGKNVSFNGNWGSQQMTEAEYNARFRDDDARYARILGVLAGVFTRMTTAPVAAPKSAH
jgi:hypothetical protein